MNPITKAIGHIISCKDASRLVSQAQDARLSVFDRWKLRMHLEVCAKCMRFDQQLQFLRKALQRFKS